MVMRETKSSTRFSTGRSGFLYAGAASLLFAAGASCAAARMPRSDRRRTGKTVRRASGISIFLMKAPGTQWASRSDYSPSEGEKTKSEERLRRTRPSTRLRPASEKQPPDQSCVFLVLGPGRTEFPAEIRDL